MANLALYRANDVSGGFVPGNQHLNRLYKALVVEIHVILDCIDLFKNVLGEELRQG